MPIYISGGKTYNIPDEKAEKFEASHPDAKVTIYNGGKTYNIPIGKQSNFKAQFPEWSYNQPSQPTAPQAKPVAATMAAQASMQPTVEQKPSNVPTQPNANTEGSNMVDSAREYANANARAQLMEDSGKVAEQVANQPLVKSDTTTPDSNVQNMPVEPVKVQPKQNTLVDTDEINEQYAPDKVLGIANEVSSLDDAPKQEHEPISEEDAEYTRRYIQEHEGYDIYEYIPDTFKVANQGKTETQIIAEWFNIANESKHQYLQQQQTQEREKAEVADSLMRSQQNWLPEEAAAWRAKTIEQTGIDPYTDVPQTYVAKFPEGTPEDEIYWAWTNESDGKKDEWELKDKTLYMDNIYARAKAKQQEELKAESAVPSYSTTTTGTIGTDVAKGLEDTRRLSTQTIRAIDKANELLEAYKAHQGDENFFVGAFKGFRDGISDIDNWVGVYMLGQMTALQDIMAKQEAGEELTQEEQDLVDALAYQMAVEASVADELGWGYTSGKTTGASLPFMLQMIASPATSATNAALKGLDKVAVFLGKNAVKKFGKSVLKKMLSKKATRAVVRGMYKVGKSKVGKAIAATVTGTPRAIIEGSIQTVLFHTDRVTADAIDRQMGNEMVVERANELFGTQMEAREGKEWTRSVLEAFATQASENVTEYLGTRVFDPIGGMIGRALAPLEAKAVGTMFKVADKMGVGDVMYRLVNLPKSQFLTGLAGRGQWNGLFGEYLEEVVNNGVNVLLGNMDAEDFVSLEQNAETLLGLAWTSLGFGLANGVSRVKQYGKAQEDINHVLRAAELAWSDNKQEWESWKARIDEMSYDELREEMRRLIVANSMATAEQRGVARERTRLAMQYMLCRSQLMGLDATDAELREASTRTPSWMQAEDAQADGIVADEEGQADIVAELTEAHQVLTEASGMDAQAFVGQYGQSADEQLRHIDESPLDANTKAAAKAYILANERYEGVAAVAEAEIERKVRAAEEEVRANINPETNTAIRVSMETSNEEGKVIDVEAYVIAGNINESGAVTLRMADGSQQMVQANKLTVVSETEADILLEGAREGARQEAVAEVAGRMSNHVASQAEMPMEVGHRVVVNGEHGSIVATDGQATRVQLDNGTEVDFTAEAVYDEAQYNKVSERSARAKEHVAEAVVNDKRKSEAPTPMRAPKAEAQIPTDANGAKQYDQAEPQAAWESILAKAKGNAKVAQAVIAEEIEILQSQVKALESASIPVVDNMDQRIEMHMQRQAEIDAINDKIARWQEVAGRATQTSEAVQESVPQSAEVQEAEVQEKDYKEIAQEHNAQIDVARLAEETGVSEEEIKQVIDFANKVGVKLNFADYTTTEQGDLTNGEAYASRREITISKLMLAEGKSLRWIMGHELTHIVKTQGTQEEWEAFRDFIKNTIGEKSWNEGIESRTKLYKEAYKNQSVAGFEAAMEEELCADQAGYIFFDASNIDRFLGVPRTLAQKIYDWFIGLVSNVPNNVKVAVELWGQMAQGNVEVSTDEEGKKHSIVGVTGARALDKIEHTTRRMDNLTTAKEMATIMEPNWSDRMDKSAHKIWLATGWDRGTDGMWRYELVDSADMFDPTGMVDYKKRHPNYERYLALVDKSNSGEALTEKEQQQLAFLTDQYGYDKLHNSRKLKDYLDFDELYDAYPELKNINIRFVDFDGEKLGNYNRTNNTITLANRSAEEMASVLFHEVQHAIQAIEGFARGGNLESAGSYDNYQRLAGEVEARNVQERLGESDKERKQIRLGSTEDIDREEQTVKRYSITQSEAEQELGSVDSVTEAAERLEENVGEVDTEKGDVRYSVHDILRGKERENAIKDLMAVTGRSRATVLKWLKAEESLAKVILDEDNVALLDIEADESVPSIWNNSDYPQGTVEFSNICKKRLPFTTIYQRLQKEYPNMVFDAQTLNTIRETMKDAGKDVACALCFVEDRRQLLGEIGQGFIDAVQGNGTKLNDKQKVALNKLAESGDRYVPNLYDILTLDGMKKLRKEHPAVAQAFIEYNNARGMQAGRLFQAYSAYNREILKYSDKKVKSINDNGGLRIFSFSDFEAHHLIDLVQVLTDCAAKGIKVQGYTKVPAFAKAVKDTGAKINRSLIPKGVGYVDADYVPKEGEAVSPNVINGKRLLFDTVEGIDVNDPNFFDSTNSKSVGNILVVINDEHARIAMADPFVDYLIGFHTSQAKEILKGKGIDTWVNYKNDQMDKVEATDINGNKKLTNAPNHGINIYTDVLNVAEAEGNPIKTAKQFTERFLEECNKRGYVPRFYRFLNRAKDGRFLYTPGYHKFLPDFKLFDKNGKILTQEPVMPIFDNEFNKQILEDYVRDVKEELPLDNVYEAVKEAIGLGGKKFSIANRNQEIFVSNAAIAVEGIKQEKGTPQQWLAMIEKNGGLKAGEDKWLGLSDWLKGLDKKSVTKQEILDFINENMIQIEEVEYGDIENNSRFKELNDEFRELYYEYDHNGDAAFEEMVSRYGEDFGLAFSYSGDELWVEDTFGSEAAEYFLGVRSIDATRREYTTDGLGNKQEIALVVPAIESWNQSDIVHFGDAGDGRAVAWIRFGETIDSEGKRVLVIDEIQSKRHQEGRDQGYVNPRVIQILDRLNAIENKAYSSNGISEETLAERKALNDELLVIFESENPQMAKIAGLLKEKGARFSELQQQKAERQEDEKVEMLKLQKRQFETRSIEDYDYYEQEINNIKEAQERRDEEIEELRSSIPRLHDEYNRYYTAELRNTRKGVMPAPFEKNWHELAMKRMLRYAAENGFDKVAWTTGAQQAERYNLSHHIDEITSIRNGGGYQVSAMKDGEAVYENWYDSESKLAEDFGKDIAHRIFSDQETGNTQTFKGLDLKVGGEGMKGFYDKMLPSFMGKYGKKWGAKVGEVTLPYLEESAQHMWSVDITPEMKESVMQGQVMFSINDNNVASYIYNMDATRAWMWVLRNSPKGVRAKGYGYIDKNRLEEFQDWYDSYLDWGADEYIQALEELKNKATKKAQEYIDEVIAGVEKHRDDFRRLAEGDDSVLSTSNAAKFSISAYHGSAAEFDKFDRNFAGSGEGQAVMGAGHYVTTSEGTGRYYAEVASDMRRKVVQEGGYTYNGEVVRSRSLVSAYETLKRNDFDVDKAIESVKRGIMFIKRIKGENANTATSEKELEYLSEEKAHKGTLGYQEEVIEKPARHLYEVEIPDDNGKNYFDLDKKATKKTKEEAKKRLLDALLNGEEADYWKDNQDTIESVWRDSVNTFDATNNSVRGTMEQFLTQEEVSDILSDMGYVGSKSQATDGTTYIIYNDADVKIKNHTKFSLSADILAANERFNEELDEYIKKGTKANFIFHIGQPLGVMKIFFPELPIVMRPRVINKASNTKHDVDATSLYNLPQYIAEPIFVFQREDGAIGILTEMMDNNGKNVCVAVELNKKIQDGGTYLDVNDIRSIHGRDVKNIVLPIIHNNTLKYADKEKALDWFSSASSIYQQEITSQELSDVTKIVQDFQNPPIPKDESSQNVENATSGEQKYSLSPIPGRMQGESFIDYAHRVAAEVERQRAWQRTGLQRALALDQYEERVASGWYQTQEALQDSMLGLKALMQSIVGDGTYIEDIPDHENPYLGENRLSSVNQAEAELFAKLMVKPMLEEVSKLARNDEALEELTDYVMAKHGLERNLMMAAKEAQQLFNKKGNTRSMADIYSECRKKDYAGLTALTGEGKVADAEVKAQQMVDAYEAAHYTDALWDKINALNNAILLKQKESGMLSEKLYQEISGMYDYYIPLRGFDETTIVDVYAYLDTKPMGEGAVQMRAKGRRSKADSPWAYMQSMADQVIMQGNRNKLVKQKLLNFVMNHPSDAVSISRVYLKYNADENRWEMERPEFDGNETEQEKAAKWAEFASDMEDLSQQHPSLYKTGREAVNMKYKVPNQDMLGEHQVLVRTAVGDFVITVQGNPRAAQAANGLTNPDNPQGVWKWIESINRHLSNVYTSANPDFVYSNWVRDSLFGNTMVWIKESPRYAAKFHLNWMKYNPVRVNNLLNKWENNELDMSDPTEAMFYDFMVNGGETGYTSVRDIEAHKDAIKKELKKIDSGVIRSVLSALIDKLTNIARGVENGTRFAAYVTSMEEGRGIGRSIWDAKEISVNFNKKGAGARFVDKKGQTVAGDVAGYVSRFGRIWHIFWNAALQGTTNFGRQAKRHPVKALTALSTMYCLGYLVAMASAWDDDDKKEDELGYLDIPEYTRRSNIVIKTVAGHWLTVPLPIEYRAVYGMGELCATVMSGKVRMSDGELAGEMAKMAMQAALPVDIFAGDTWWWNVIIPSSLAPIVSAKRNVSWTGVPIYKETPFNEAYPEWTKAYRGADRHLVEATRWLSDATGGNKSKPGWVDLNPAQIEYILDGYLGGWSTMTKNLVKTGEMVLGKREYDARNIPIWRRMVTMANEHTENRNANEMYWNTKKVYDEVSRLQRDYEKYIKNGENEYIDDLVELRFSEDYELYKVIKKHKAHINDLNERIKVAKEQGNAEAEKIANAEFMDLKKSIADEVNKILDGAENE